MDFELRVLSGLHRGACLPVGLDEKLRLGSGSDCDIVLVDHGLQGLEWLVWLEEGGWCVAKCDSTGRPQEQEHLSWGQPEVLGGIVVSICASTDEWVFVSAEDVVIPAESDLASLSEGSNTISTSSKKKSPKRFKTLPRIILGGSLVLGVATFSISRTVNLEDAAPNRPPAALSAAPIADLPAGASFADSFLVAPEGMPTPLHSSEGKNPEALAKLFVQRLHAIELSDKVELDLTPEEWIIRGALDEDEKTQIDRVASSFFKEHKINIPLKLSVNSPEELLPFKVVQFNGGSMASVVLDDGTRMYLGDIHKGYSLRSIDGRRVTFAGKRKVEIIW